jgi:general secretion pathway protein A
MYTEFYGLREKPFSLSPDPRFLFLSDSHREALAHLLYGIEQGEGFIAITGEVGTGKTTLCRTLLQRIEPGSEVAFLFNPQLSGVELLQAINAELGLETEGKTRRELMDQLNRFLLVKRQEGRRVLLLIDEAQNLEREALEQVRLLSNLETDTSKLIQIILIAQPELDAMLERPELRQLRQRINVRWRLRPLSASETRDYVRHRLRVAAGGPRGDIFSDLALREIHRRSGGVPRIINRLCDRALLAGFAGGVKEIGLGTVAEVQRELEGREAVAPRPGARGAGLGEFLTTHRLELGAAAGAFFAVLVSAAVLWWHANRAPTPEERAAAMAAMPAPASPGPVEAAPPPVPVEAALPPVPVEAAPPPVPLDPDPVPEAAPATVSPPAAAPEPPSEPAVDASAAASPPADLGSLLPRTAPAETLARSLDGLLQRWGGEPLGAGVLSFVQFREVLENAGFAVLSLEHASLDLVAAIDRPAIVVLSALDGAQRGVLLTGLDGESVTLEGLGAGPLRIARAEIAAHWSGQVLVPWKDHAGLPPLVGPGTSGQSVRWLQQALGALGLYAGEDDGDFDAETWQAVRAFQARESLAVDGWVGPLTLIRLYERLPGYEAPPRIASAAAAPAHGGTS